jgi:hypothetical protein
MAMFRLALVVPLDAALGSRLGHGVSRAIRTGIANAGGTLISVRERPRVFWLVIGVQLGFTAVCGLMLWELLVEALSRAV